MDNKFDVIKTFYEKCFQMEPDFIIEMSKHPAGVGLNNVIVGLNRHCFGVTGNDSKDEKKYSAFYVNSEAMLDGYMLDLHLDNPDRDELIFYFALHMAKKFPNLDAFSLFNSFQIQTRSYIEQIGYLSINPEELKKYGEGTILASGVKGIYKVPVYSKVDFYKSLFDEKELPELTDSDKYVYLMINGRNNLFKIGSSKQPNFREKTLQAEEPEIFLIAQWEAPISIEKHLHQIFKAKRKRGEWFALSLDDILNLKEEMEKYSKIGPWRSGGFQHGR